MCSCARCGGDGTGPTDPAPIGGCPGSLSCPAGLRCGCEVISGLGARKQQRIELGADASFLASAMMETREMKTDYKYGDGKTHDAFNAGLCKQNWFLSRRCHQPWSHLGPNDYHTFAVLNSNTRLDIEVYGKCRQRFSKRLFFASHRNGETGFYNPNTDGINKFIQV